MRKTNKIIALGLLSLALSLASCGGEGSTSSIDSSVSPIQEVYETYKANGGELSYEDWLSSIKGEKGDKGDKGDAGAPGEKGDPGADGKDGSSVLTGEGEPSSDLGKDGDSYIDTSTFDYYVKADGEWLKKGNIKGEDGANGGQGEKGDPGVDGKDGVDGIDGVDGKDGSSVLTGEGEPSSDLGKDGDSYLDTSTYDFYVKSDGTWTKSENIKGKHAVTYYVDDTKVATTEVRHGEKAKAPEINLPGRTINAWNCKEDGGYRWLFSAYAVTSDLELYADYSGLSYEVTLVDTRFSLGEKTVSVTYGEEYDFTKVFSKPGYLVSFANEESEIASKGTWNVASGATYYASWSADPSCAVSVTSEDENKGSAEMVSYSEEIGGKVKVKATPKQGYCFYAWYAEGECLSNKEEFTYVRPEQAVTLEARFLSQKEYDAKYGANPVLGEDETTLTYGLYPSKRVKDKATLTSLASLTKEENEPYYFYEGDYYCTVAAKTSEGTEGYLFDDGDVIVPGSTYWFKCEPISWNVVSNEDGVYSLIATKSIDGGVFDETSNNYKESDVRKFLLNDFLSNAFALGSSHILEKEVDNSEASGLNEGSNTNPYCCENTKDKVYLPSFQEIRSLTSGVGATTTDFARARNCPCVSAQTLVGEEIYHEFDATSYYWTRSPDACGENYGWVFDGEGNGLHFASVNQGSGIRPGMKISLD